MAEYIDKKTQIEELKRIYHAHYVKAREQSIHDVFKAVFKKLSNAPAADVVEVVRCGECIHNYGVKANCEFNPHDIVCDWWSTDGMDETDFCSRGERRSE